MFHRTRWTPQKIKQRLDLIAPLVYSQKKSISPFHYLELNDALTPPPTGVEVDDSSWQEIAAGEYWGSWMQNFVLRATFALPENWDKDQPTALYLPLGEAGDFSHPEGLSYIDGVPYAACDRHHQEILLSPAWLDGKQHTLAIHGWTGLGGATKGSIHTALYAAMPIGPYPSTGAGVCRPGSRSPGNSSKSG
jgi:alpha-mannosidase